MRTLLVSLTITVLMVMPVFSGECAFRVRVVDEDSNPVTNATVNVAFTKYSGLTCIPYKKLHELTDTNGTWSYQGPCDDGVEWNVEKTGYYLTIGGDIQFSKKPTLGRFEPWNELHEVQLRKIINPIPMYARITGREIPPPKLPELGKPIGFDLINSDWVSPYGKGETPDFIFCITSKSSLIPKEYYEKYPRSFRYRDMEGQISFAKDGDGLQCVMDDPRSNGSIFRLSRYAPESGYESNLVRVSRVVYIPPRAGTYDGDILSQGDPEQGLPEQNYFFRVRSQRDQNGAITNALYGKIRGPIGLNSGGYISFTYFLNPTPNDRNLEYDAKHNLLKDLIGDGEPPPPGP